MLSVLGGYLSKGGQRLFRPLGRAFGFGLSFFLPAFTHARERDLLVQRVRRGFVFLGLVVLAGALGVGSGAAFAGGLGWALGARLRRRCRGRFGGRAARGSSMRIGVPSASVVVVAWLPALSTTVARSS